MGVLGTRLDAPELLLTETARLPTSQLTCTRGSCCRIPVAFGRIGGPGIPCLTLRENTERPATVTHRTNRPSAPNPARIMAAFDGVPDPPPPNCRNCGTADGSAHCLRAASFCVGRVNGRRFAAAITLLVSAALGVLALEVALRIVDHQPLTRLTLTAATAAAPTRSSSVSSPDLQHRPAVTLAAGVNGEWYLEEPPPRPRFPLDSQLAARSAKYPADPYTPFFEFNRRFAERQICNGQPGVLGGLDDFFFFEPPDGQPYPTYRHLAHVSPPHWFVTNNFGWRGPDVDASAPRTIRLPSSAHRRRSTATARRLPSRTD